MTLGALSLSLAHSHPLHPSRFAYSPRLLLPPSVYSSHVDRDTIQSASACTSKAFVEKSRGILLKPPRFERVPSPISGERAMRMDRAPIFRR